MLGELLFWDFQGKRGVAGDPVLGLSAKFRLLSAKSGSSIR